MDRAGTTGTDTAAKLGAGQLKMLADHPQQRRIRLTVKLDLMAVQIELHATLS
ncbi:hypothetical protein D3C72_2516530 [compost metagenome]